MPKLGFPFLSNTLFLPEIPYNLYPSLSCTARNSKQFTFLHLLTRSLASDQGIRLPLLLEGCILILLLVPVPLIWIYIFSRFIISHFPYVTMPPCLAVLEYSSSKARHRFCSLPATVPTCGRRPSDSLRTINLIDSLTSSLTTHNLT